MSDVQTTTPEPDYLLMDRGDKIGISARDASQRFGPSPPAMIVEWKTAEALYAHLGPFLATHGEGFAIATSASAKARSSWCCS